MRDTISDVTRRTQGYWFVDGLVEIGSGILFIIVSIPYLLWSLVPPDSAWSKVASGGRNILLLLGIVVFFVAIQAAKSRSTYPRTGYVEEQQPDRKQILTAGALGVAGVLVFAGLVVAGSLLFPAFRQGLFNVLAYIPAFIGLIMVFIQISLGFRTGLKRFYWLAGMAALTSLGLVLAARFHLAAQPFDWTFIAHSGPNDPMPVGSAAALTGLLHYVYRGAAFFFTVQGLAMLVSGLIVRSSYLRQHHLLQDAEK
jgi:hypothetical protein